MRLAIGFGMVLALSGCFAIDTYYAEGVSIATRDRDVGICERQALVDFPVEQAIRTRPRVFHPGRQICDAEGNNCVLEPGYWTGGEVYTVDLNRSARARGVIGCMGGRGYMLISLPSCNLNGPVAASTIMPALSKDSCAIARGGASPFVITPP